MRKLTLILLAMALCICCFSLIACDEEESTTFEPVEYTVGYTIGSTNFNYTITTAENGMYPFSLSINGGKKYDLGAVFKNEDGTVSYGSEITFTLNDDKTATIVKTANATSLPATLAPTYDMVAGEYTPIEGFVLNRANEEAPEDPKLYIRADGTATFIDMECKVYPLMGMYYESVLLVNEEYEGILLKLDKTKNEYSNDKNDLSINFRGSSFIERYYEFYYENRTNYVGERSMNTYLLEISDNGTFILTNYDVAVIGKCKTENGVTTLTSSDYNSTDKKLVESDELVEISGDKFDLVSDVKYEVGEKELVVYKNGMCYTNILDISSGQLQIVRGVSDDNIVAYDREGTHIFNKNLDYIGYITRPNVYVSHTTQNIYKDLSSNKKLIVDKTNGKALVCVSTAGPDGTTPYYAYYDNLSIANNCAFATHSQGDSQMYLLMADTMEYFCVPYSTQIYSNIISEGFTLKKYDTIEFISSLGWQENVIYSDSYIFQSGNKCAILVVNKEYEACGFSDIGETVKTYPLTGGMIVDGLSNSRVVYIFIEDEGKLTIRENENEIYGTKAQAIEDYFVLYSESSAYLFNNKTGEYVMRISDPDFAGFSNLVAYYIGGYEDLTVSWYKRPHYVSKNGDFVYIANGGDAIEYVRYECTQTPDIFENEWYYVKNDTGLDFVMMIQNGHCYTCHIYHDYETEQKNNFDIMLDEVNATTITSKTTDTLDDGKILTTLQLENGKIIEITASFNDADENNSNAWVDFNIEIE